MKTDRTLLAITPERGAWLLMEEHVDQNTVQFRDQTSPGFTCNAQNASRIFKEPLAGSLIRGIEQSASLAS